jgi:hypothetical protein
MLKRIIILLNVALVFQWTDAIGQFNGDKINGGFRELRQYKYNYKSGLIDTNSKRLEYSKKFDSRGNIIEFIWWKSDTILFRDTYKLDALRKTVEYLKLNSNDQITDKGIMSYDGKGNLIESVRNRPDGQISDKESWKYDEKGKLIENIRIKPDGQIIHKLTNRFNEMGFLIENTYYDQDSSMNSHVSIKYDEKGNDIEEIYNNWFCNHQIKKKISKFNMNGKKIEDIYYNSDQTINFTEIYRYDDKGNNIEFSSFEPDGELSYQEISKFDKNGKKIETINYKFDGLTNSSFHFCSYNENEQIIEEIYCEPNGNILSKEINKYDEWGNRIEEIHFNSSDEPEYCYKYIYSK